MQLTLQCVTVCCILLQRVAVCFLPCAAGHVGVGADGRVGVAVDVCVCECECCVSACQRVCQCE